MLRARERKWKAKHVKAADVRRAAMAKFVARHCLSCFVCKRTDQEWAKVDTNAHGPWAICVPCVKERRQT
jgi:hypothetical protein